MALSQQIIDLIRDEIGPDPDFCDNDTEIPDPAPPTFLDSLERIYLDPERGNQNILRTALVCWRKRRSAFVARGFDISTQGTLINRRQRMIEMNRRVKELELMVDTSYRHRNAAATIPFDRGAELSR